MYHPGHPALLVILLVISVLLCGYIYKLKKFTSRIPYVGIMLLGLVTCLLFMGFYMEIAERYHFDGDIEKSIKYIYYGFLYAE